MIRTATPDDALLLAQLHDQARKEWPDFTPESPEGVRSAVIEDGMVYLLLERRGAVCTYADEEHGYGFMDFPYSDLQDAEALIVAALLHLPGLRVECPLPESRTTEAELLGSLGFQPGRSQRRMVVKTLHRESLPMATGEAQAIFPGPDDVEALHALVYPDHGKLAGWRTDPDVYPGLGLVMGSQLVGYALTSFHGGFYWLSELAVHPDFRRRGFGRTLLEMALQQLKTAGADEIHLYVNENHAQHATHLYESVGFQTSRQITRYIRETP